MEQVMGGRYTARKICDERRKHRKSEVDEEGVGYQDGITMTQEIADCAILLGIISVFSFLSRFFCFCLLREWSTARWKVKLVVILAGSSPHLQSRLNMAFEHDGHDGWCFQAQFVAGRAGP
jgi:hypothetical protein